VTPVALRGHPALAPHWLSSHAPSCPVFKPWGCGTLRKGAA